MKAFEINREGVEKLGKVISKLDYNPVSFDSPEFFPSGDDFIYTNYVFFMVAIDHRTHGNQRFEAFVNGKFYHGSDLMYRLARKAQEKIPDFFTAERLKSIEEEEIRKVFSINDLTVANPSERAMLLKDAAEKLINYYSGDFRVLIEKSGNYLLHKNNSGILQRLKVFKAYKDPLMKKSFLLVKILKRQNYLRVKDIHNLSVPVDNVLMNIALRSNLLHVRKIEVQNKLMKGIMLNENEVDELRKATKKGFEHMCKKFLLQPDVIDDILWTYGREVKRVKADEVDRIKTPLDERIGNKEALREFLHIISSGELRAAFPETWYF